MSAAVPTASRRALYVAGGHRRSVSRARRRARRLAFARDVPRSDDRAPRAGRPQRLGRRDHRRVHRDDGRGRRSTRCARPAPASSSAASTSRDPSGARSSSGTSAAATSRTTQHDPVVVDWRAPISAPFYRATAIDPLGVVFRRRFTFAEGEMTAYLDEHLDDPDAADVAAGIPDPVLAEIGAARSGAMREIVATIQAEQDIVIRAPIDQALIVQGGPGTGKTAVALHRAAYLLFEHRRRLARDGVLVVGPNRAFLDYIANVLPSLGERSVRQCTALDLCIPKVEITARRRTRARLAGRVRPSVSSSSSRLALDAIQPPDDDVARADRSAHARVRAGVDRRLDRHRQVGRRADQPTPRAAARARPAGAAAAIRRRGLLVAGRPAQVGDQRLLADAAADPARRPHAARPVGPPPALDRGRPVPRRRGQHAAQRHAVHVRPRRRRRGAGPFGGGAAGDRPPLRRAARSRWSATSPSRPRRPARSGGRTCSPTSAPTARSPT